MLTYRQYVPLRCSPKPCLNQNLAGVFSGGVGASSSNRERKRERERENSGGEDSAEVGGLLGGAFGGGALCAAGHGDDAGLNHFGNAELGQHGDEGVDLALLAGKFDDHGVEVEVDHLAAEHLDQLQHFRALLAA